MNNLPSKIEINTAQFTHQTRGSKIQNIVFHTEVHSRGENSNI